MERAYKGRPAARGFAIAAALCIPFWAVVAYEVIF